MEKIIETAQKYECSAREIKLRTRAGMGHCGGRICRPLLDAVISDATGRKPDHAIPLKIQPPVRPLTLSEIGETDSHE